MDVIDLIKRDEGLSLFAYKDTQGFNTIGYGTRIDSIDSDEATFLLQHRIQKVIDNQKQLIPWLAQLNEPRQAVFASMQYNLGQMGFWEFHKMLAAAKAGDFETAAKEMLNTLWHQQVGKRAERLAEQMRTGKWQ